METRQYWNPETKVEITADGMTIRVYKDGRIENTISYTNPNYEKILYSTLNKLGERKDDTGTRSKRSGI